MFFSFLVPFVLVSTLEMVVMVVNILVTRPWWVMPRVTPRVTHPKQGGPVASPKQVVLLDKFLVTVVAIEWLISNALSGCPSGRIPYLSGGS